MRDEIDPMTQGRSVGKTGESMGEGFCSCGGSDAPHPPADDPGGARVVPPAQFAPVAAAESPSEPKTGGAGPDRRVERLAAVRPALPVRLSRSPHGVSRPEATQPTPPAAPAPSARPAEAPRPHRVSRLKVVPALIAAIVLAVAAIGIALALSGGLASPGDRAAKDGGASGSSAPIRLTHRFTTMYTADDARYPSFTFSYPSGWSIAENSADETGERVTLSSDTGLSVIFEHRVAGGDVVNRPAAKLSIERAGAASFVPGSVRENSYRSLGSFIVARLEAGTDGASAVEMGADTCYALVPGSALEDRSVITTTGTVPSFNYGDHISFYCLTPEKGLSRARRRQVIAILGSLTVNAIRDSNSEKNPDTRSSGSDQDGAFLLPDSATRLYGADELGSLSTEELFVARNEIYARHGRIFKNETLNSHFRQKTWYRPSVAAEDFSTSVLSDIEKRNVETIHQIEVDRGSPHV